MFIKGGEKMKTKIIILCSALINIGLIAALIFSKTGNDYQEISKTGKYKIVENSSTIKLYSEDNNFEVLIDKDTEKLISFNYFLSDFQQSAAIETDKDHLQRVSYHGKDFTLTFIKSNGKKENKDFSLGIYKHKEDNPYALEYYTQFIFDEDGNYKIIE